VGGGGLREKVRVWRINSDSFFVNKNDDSTIVNIGANKTMTEIILTICVILIIINIILTFFKKSDSNSGELRQELIKTNLDISKLDPLIRNEFSNNREEIQKSTKGMREELSNLFRGFSGSFTNSAMENRTELSVSFSTSLKSFEETFSTNIKDFNELQRQKFGDLSHIQGQLKLETEIKLEKIRETIENKLTSLQEENSKKLEEMRNTVDEKLQSTLEKRFNDSFTLISNRLEQVHKGLGEMQSLASSVGDLKKVMTNVKSRGILGEYQLANILEDLLTNEQYEKNVKTKLGSGAIVEFAVKMPNNSEQKKVLWLPIDSKFPKEDYESLVDAYDDGEPEKIERLRKAFKYSIVKNAKEIKEKYIDPPNTTEYAIMFLPFESLFAEVLRTPGLFELLQKDHKIVITGPTTLSALLNSLQMGFRTLAIEKRSSDVWDLLGAVKSEFNQFGNILEKTKKKLQEATNTINTASVRSRAIEKQLKKVQELPSSAESEVFKEQVDSDAEDFDLVIDNLLVSNNRMV
jgi:DNA recombination protein RmuC